MDTGIDCNNNLENNEIEFIDNDSDYENNPTQDEVHDIPAVQTGIENSYRQRKSEFIEPQGAEQGQEQQITGDKARRISNRTTTAIEHPSVSGSNQQRQPIKMSHDSDKRWKDISEFNMRCTQDVINHADRMHSFILNKKGFPAHDWQVRNATVVKSGYDLLAIAPTGSGKSLCYQMLFSEQKHTHVLISPLTELILEQVKELNDMGIKAVAFTGDNLLENPHLWHEFEKDSTIQVVVGSPEVLCKQGSRFWRGLNKDRKKHPFFKRLSTIVLDEAHMLWKWGRTDGGEDNDSAFRADFQLIGNFRMAFPTVPFLLLSATMTLVVEAYLHKTLGLQTPCFVSRRPLHRPNIDLIMAGIQHHSTFQDLDFLLKDLTNIPQTMIYVDDRTKAQHIARYLRGKALALGSNPALVSVYTGYYDKNTRTTNMKRFKERKCLIMVCTEAAGMGLNIQTVDLVIQFRIPERLTLFDLMQRIGRAGRNANKKAAAIVFVDDKYILLDSQILDASEQSKGRNFGLAITPETVENRNVWDMLNTMYSEQNRKTGSRLDPGIMWLINTIGCRSRVHLSVLGDMASGLDFDAASSVSACNCDNCKLPPMRSNIDRLIPPLCLTEGLFAKGLKAVDRDALKERLHAQYPELVQERKNAALKLRASAEAQSVFNFTFNRTLRYHDSSAKVEDDEEKRNIVIATRASARSKRLTTSITNAMLEVRGNVYHREQLQSKLHIIEPFLLSRNMIEKIAGNVLLQSIPPSEFNLERFKELVTGPLKLADSFLHDFAKDFHLAIEICLLQEDQLQHTEEADEEERVRRANRSITPLWDDIEKRYCERTQSRSRSRSQTPISYPHSGSNHQATGQIDAVDSDFQNSITDNSQFTEYSYTQRPPPSQPIDDPFPANDQPQYSQQDLSSHIPLEYPDGIPPPLPIKRRKYELPWEPKELFDFTKSEDVIRWNNQVRQRLYDENMHAKANARKEDTLRKRAAREIANKNEAAYQRKKQKQAEAVPTSSRAKRRRDRDMTDSKAAEAQLQPELHSDSETKKD